MFILISSYPQLAEAGIKHIGPNNRLIQQLEPCMDLDTAVSLNTLNDSSLREKS